MLVLQIFGQIKNPFNTLCATGTGCPGYTGLYGGGLITLLNNLLKFIIIVAGLYALWNFVSAGYMFMSAGGEAKAIEKAWAKIWQSLIGLLIVAGSFVLAGIFGYLIFGNASAIITPVIYGP